MRPHFSLLTVFLLLSLYLLPSFNSSLQYLSTRKLYDEDSKNKVCSKIEDYKELNYTNLAEYVKEMNFGESSAKDLVIGLLTKGSLDGIKDVLSDVGFWIFLLVLSILIILSKFYILICFSMAYLHMWLLPQ